MEAVQPAVGQTQVVAAGVAEASLSLHVPAPESAFTPLDRFGAITWDYTASGRSTRPLPCARQTIPLKSRDFH